MIRFTVHFFFFEVFEETFTTGIIERISFLGKSWKMTVQHSENPITAGMQMQYIVLLCQNET